MFICQILFLIFQIFLLFIKRFIFKYCRRYLNTYDIHKLTTLFKYNIMIKQLQHVEGPKI